ncbi:MAG: glycosyltransferase, partial [Chloroflexota bacterium]
VDTERFRARDAAERDRFVIGWTGISPNFSFLYAIEAPLERILRRLDDAELLVVADRPPEFRRIDPRRVRFIAWSPATEAEAVRQMDVGLMPLADSEWARGKCSFKMLQYMACGVPVVVSPVGMNADVLAMGEVGLVARDEQEWCEAIELLYADRPRGRAYGAQGRAIVERHFSRTVVATQLAGIFQEIVQCTPAIPAQQ